MHLSLKQLLRGNVALQLVNIILPIIMWPGRVLQKQKVGWKWAPGTFITVYGNKIYLRGKASLINHSLNKSVFSVEF